MRAQDKPAFPYAEIEKKIGYTFENKSLLKQAFTHSTYAHLHGGEDNERMEYLGDSVLQLIVTDYQYKSDKTASEGELTRNRQKLVCEQALDEIVSRLQIEKYLLIAGGKANIGKKTTSSLFETVTAAIYLDGGYAKAEAFILNNIASPKQATRQNPKGELQEYLQSVGEKTPAYQTRKEGKDNAPRFFAEVSASGKTGKGEGGSKREAEQNAAQALLAQFTLKNKQ